MRMWQLKVSQKSYGMLGDTAHKNMAIKDMGVGDTAYFLSYYSQKMLVHINKEHPNSECKAIRLTCGECIFTLDYLTKGLSDLIEPIAEEKVNNNFCFTFRAFTQIFFILVYSGLSKFKSP